MFVCASFWNIPFTIIHITANLDIKYYNKIEILNLIKNYNIYI